MPKDDQDQALTADQSDDLVKPSDESVAEAKAEQSSDLILQGAANERSLVPIANFPDGFASGWFMAVPKAFSEALDIRQDNRVYGGVRTPVLTQGRLFSFKAGDTLYDSRAAYTLPWKEALKQTRLCIRIESATSVSEVQTMEYKSNSAVGITKTAQGKAPEVLKGDKQVIFRRKRLQHGRIVFKVLTPDSENISVAERRSFECDQEEFVVFLQTGMLRTTSNQVFNFQLGFPLNS